MENLFIHTKWRVQELVSKLFPENSSHFKTDYGKPSFYSKESLQYLLEGSGILLLFAYFFYRSFWAVLLLSPFVYFYYRYRQKQQCRKRMETLELQFKETLLSVETNLQAGYSMENAFLESYPNIVRLYGANCDMAGELLQIRRGLANGNSLEALLLDLGSRCPGSEMEEFAEIYMIASKTGSRWDETIAKITKFIGEKLEIKQEIEIIIHGRKMESKIMCLIPFFILLYMNLTSPGYFDVLYGNIAGVLIMSICLGAYIAAYLLMEKVTESVG